MRNKSLANSVLVSALSKFEFVVKKGWKWLPLIHLSISVSVDGSKHITFFKTLYCKKTISFPVPERYFSWYLNLETDGFVPAKAFCKQALRNHKSLLGNTL